MASGHSSALAGLPSSSGPAPIGLDPRTMFFEYGGDGFRARLAPQQAPLAPDLLAGQQEQLLLHRVPEDQADARGDGDGVGVQRLLDVAAELVLGEVLLEGVVSGDDAVAVRLELLALRLVAEHHADDQRLAGQGTMPREASRGARQDPR